jgi:hypothetical protein
MVIMTFSNVVILPLPDPPRCLKCWPFRFEIEPTNTIHSAQFHSACNQSDRQSRTELMRVNCRPGPRMQLRVLYCYKGGYLVGRPCCYLGKLGIKAACLACTQTDRQIVATIFEGFIFRYEMKAWCGHMNFVGMKKVTD